MKGIINVLKPTGMTSHDVVYFIRKTLNIKKVGHTGTLDPNAAGVLPICVGKATKISQYLTDKKKTYRAELTLGQQTDTQDKYGQVINESQKSVSEDEIINVFKKFMGDIMQIPPMYSAIKIKGKKLYELARQGKTVERSPRKVTIYKLEIINITGNRILFDVECSKGTYIRTLCDDIGNELGTYGHMSVLIRTQVDKFSIFNSCTLEQIKKTCDEGNIDNILFPLDYALFQYKELTLDDKYFKIIENGGNVSLDNNIRSESSIYSENEKVRVYCKDTFIGIGVIHYTQRKYLKMDKVLL